MKKSGWFVFLGKGLSFKARSSMFNVNAILPNPKTI
jgi:hypothetical protein